MHLPSRIRAQIAAIVLASAGVTASAQEVPPNVVLILADDQHWGDYGFLGHEELRTPALDRLAREGLVFSRGYVPSSLCCPSLASLVTGRYPHEHLIVGNDPPGAPNVARGSEAAREAFTAGRERMNRHLEAWPTLPKLLGAHGYTSLQTGKWWQGDFRRGGFDEGLTRGQRHGDEGLAIGRKTMDPVYEFVRRCRGERRPFFVWYAPMLPHDPHDPPTELVEHYASKTDSIHVARYWGNVERFDRTVGELLDFLDEEGLASDTLVVFVADNGWIQRKDAPRFAPRSKRSPYDGGLRTPIVLRRPGAIPSGTSEALASSLDLLPTLLAACGIPAPTGLPGLDLLDAKAVAARKQIFGACYTHDIVDLDQPARSLLWRWTIRRDGAHLWKLIEPVTSGVGGTFPKREEGSITAEERARFERGESELFELATDPAETKNLAAEQPSLVRELRAELDAWWRPTIQSGR
jgi:arylsulfatase A-like enzyme